MTQPSRTTVASITFEGDHRLTALQALSVDRLFELDELEEYLIVLNGRDNSDLRVTLAGLLYGAVSAELWDRIRFLVPADIPRGGDGQGWHGQQALKLGLADLVRTDTYLMLDGKNHFVRPAGVADFYETGRPKTVWSDTSPYWDKYVRASLDAFDVLTDENARRMMPTTTPYLFISEEVRGTIDGLESKYGIPLKSAMGKTKWGTEFFLYYAHLVAEDKLGLYVDAPSPVRTLFTSWPQDPAAVLRMIAEAASGEVVMFGLHRNRLSQLTEEQRNAVTSMWHQDLLKPWEQGDWFMEQ